MKISVWAGSNRLGRAIKVGIKAGIKAGLTLSIAFTLAGCAMKSAHYASLGELSENSSWNYSRQILQTLADMRDKASLPALFQIELGSSTWAPSYQAGIAPTFAPPIFRGDRTQIEGQFGFSEQMGNMLQMNNFGSAAMTRVTSLYGVLVFPSPLGDQILPNGALYTLVDEADSPDGFLIHVKTQNGRYLGVPPEKQVEFLRFARDVFYWSRNSEPDTKDLASVAGYMLRASYEFPSKEMALAEAIVDRETLTNMKNTSRQRLDASEAAYEDRKTQAITAEIEPRVMQTLLELESEAVVRADNDFRQFSSRLSEVETNIELYKLELDNLLTTLRYTLTEIIKNDPQAAHVDIDVAVHGLQNRIDRIMQGDFEHLGLQIPQAHGVNARDSSDELYRQRFLSLPQRFSGSQQGIQ